MNDGILPMADKAVDVHLGELYNRLFARPVAGLRISINVNILQERHASTDATTAFTNFMNLPPIRK
jgi:hypothetical protein